MINAEYAREALNYNHETGIFTWRGDRPKSHFLHDIAWRRWVGRYKDKVTGCKHTGRYTNYKKINIAGNSILCHRLAWLMYYGELPKNIIDHIDGDGMNNAIANLRDCDYSTNGLNCRVSKNSSTGVNGVSWDKSRGKYVAKIMINRKNIHLGRYETIKEAEQARKDYESRIHS